MTPKRKTVMNVVKSGYDNSLLSTLHLPEAASRRPEVSSF